MKTIGKIAASVASLLVLVVLGAAFWPASDYEPPARDIRDESGFGLDEKAGWYRLEDGTHRLLTWGPENGMVLYGFGATRDSLARRHFTPASELALTSSGTARIDFLETESGTLSEAQLTDKDGNPQTIVRTTGVGYETKEVTFGSGSVELAGLLYVPDKPAPHPAVAFIHGSGVSNRDAFWYLSPADYLAKRGIVVLLPDKRGCGKSGGEWHTASFETFADDALAAVSFLAHRPEVDGARIGLAGFSQGGWIAPLAASRSDAVDFVVTISASAATPLEQLLYEIKNEIAGAGAPDVLAGTLAPLFARRARMPRKRWWELNGSFDPIPHWGALEVPALMIFGEQDENVDVARSLSLLESSGIADRERFETLVFPELSHGLIRTDTRWLDGDYLEAFARFAHQ